ncbi:MAG: GNAT family N-acetyltransferase [Aquihabitans sp.]
MTSTSPASSAPSFRAAGPDDVDAIVRLVTDAYRGEASTAGWTTEDALLKGQRTDAVMVTASVVDPSGEVVLAENGGVLVGCIHVQHADAAAHFGMFAVDPNLQAAGTGSALLAQAEDRARRWGCTTMDLEVVAQRAELIAWYERRGYQRTGETRPFPYGDERFGIPQRDDLHFVVLRREL